jgi:hypothetical protein
MLGKSIKYRLVRSVLQKLTKVKSRHPLRCKSGIRPTNSPRRAPYIWMATLAIYLFQIHVRIHRYSYYSQYCFPRYILFYPLPYTPPPNARYSILWRVLVHFLVCF